MKRYAIYAVPGTGGEHDSAEARALKSVVDSWYARPDLQDLTVSTRRYGFHATLVAPFHLAGAHTEGDLIEAVQAFTNGRDPVVIPAPHPAAMGSFRALRAGGDQSELNEFAASVVREFDHFRAPLSEADVHRRRAPHLTWRQRELFDRWGYPYVFDEFTFHLTLTDALPAERTVEVDAALAQHFAGVAGVDVPLTGLTISVEPEPGAAFEVLAVSPFVHPLAHSFALETI
ncbi:DUF1045 domain-containing protein [Cryobacterium frigoriphilum]|uniref:DUF1045 domain-containing protein n=1 Tax=Cryobacterium frigoriphilum TaxID=1259150 RepID=A0A4R8ZUG3_9MICO|nr:DUF1045 domain-containing protein [Cryobacterium frigoriphilum]TFD45952.1 DUF1045 domain-containing protein [Cryobacterium frigoriphilum]